MLGFTLAVRCSLMRQVVRIDCRAALLNLLRLELVAFAYMGLQQLPKETHAMTASTTELGVCTCKPRTENVKDSTDPLPDRTRFCDSLSKRSDLFSFFLVLGAELAKDQNPCAQDVPFPSPFDFKEREAGLACSFASTFDAPQAPPFCPTIVNEFLLLPRPAKRLHHMQRKQNATVNPGRCRIIVESGLASRACSSGQSNPCAIFLRRQGFLILPKELVLYMSS